MRKLSGIIHYTVLEIFRNKVYYVLLLFGFVLIGSTLMLGTLGGEQRSRMILDMGLVSIETFALAISVFAAVTLILEEMDSRTLYLVLTRPVGRHQFIIGRFLGLVVVLTAAYALMAGSHALLCRFVHVSMNRYYVLSLLFSWEKIVLITAVAFFFSLFATSTVSAVTFTFFFWVMGHFSNEIRYLAGKAESHVIPWLCKLFYIVAPNFELLNIKDFPPDRLSYSLKLAALYGATYTAAAILLTIVLFRRKEF